MAEWKADYDDFCIYPTYMECINFCQNRHSNFNVNFECCSFPLWPRRGRKFLYINYWEPVSWRKTSLYTQHRRSPKVYIQARQSRSLSPKHEVGVNRKIPWGTGLWYQQWTAQRQTFRTSVFGWIKATSRTWRRMYSNVDKQGLYYKLMVFTVSTFAS